MKLFESGAKRHKCAFRCAVKMASFLIAIATAAQSSYAATSNLTVRTVHSFGSLEGSYPGGTLLPMSGGGFLGTTEHLWQCCDYGTVFRMLASGTVVTFHIFLNYDGAVPIGPLVRGPDGSYYGITAFGGDVSSLPTGYGVLFKITSAGNYSVLHKFSGQDGKYPSQLILGPDGALYGVASGGPLDAGVIFRTKTTGETSIVYAFGGLNTVGGSPEGIVFTPDGTIYGGTASGGLYGHGIIFELTPSGRMTVLHHLTQQEGNAVSGPLTLASDGYLYGATQSGGSSTGIGFGSLFRISRTGNFDLLHVFSGVDGDSPISGFVSGFDGRLYGTTLRGGTNGFGTIFAISQSGAFSSEYSFAGSEGKYPLAALTKTPAGIYGTTSAGGAKNRGAVFVFDERKPQLSIGLKVCVSVTTPIVGGSVCVWQ